MLPNIDEFLDQLRSDKEHIEERQRERQQAYKNSTDLFLNSIKNQITTLDRTSGAHTRRNKEFKEQITNVYSRYMANSYRIIKTQRRTVDEKLQLNDFLVLAYPGFAEKKKAEMEAKKAQLEKRLEMLKGMNRSENINYYEIMNQKYENFEQLNEIKARRQQLQKEVLDNKKLLQRSSSSHGEPPLEQENKYLKDFKEKYHDSNQGSEISMKQQQLHQPHSFLPAQMAPSVVQYAPPVGNDTSLLDDFLFPMGKQTHIDQWNDLQQQQKPIYQIESTDARNLREYLPNQHMKQKASQSATQFQPSKQSMLEQFTMKGPVPGNLNGQIRQQEEQQSKKKQQQMSSAQRSNNHRNPHQGEYDSEFKRFEDSRENSPDWSNNHHYQQQQQQQRVDAGRTDLKNYLVPQGQQIEYINRSAQQQQSQRPSSARKRFEQ